MLRSSGASLLHKSAHGEGARGEWPPRAEREAGWSRRGRSPYPGPARPGPRTRSGPRMSWALPFASRVRTSSACPQGTQSWGVSGTAVPSVLPFLPA